VETDLVERALREGTPLLDGEQATFVWQGSHPPRLIGDFNRWGGEPALELHPVGPGLWARTLQLPHDAYIEYAYVYDGRHVDDPFNRRNVGNGFGARNQYFHMPGATPTPGIERERGHPHGKLTRHVVYAEHVLAGGKRDVYLYAPPVEEPSPLLVVLDGPDYLRRARLVRIVDNLIAQGRIRPLALALVANAGRNRYVEYACNDATVGFLLGTVTRLAHERLNLVDVDRQPGAYGVLGASMGGLCAFYMGLRAPGVFGHVLSQSGALALGPLGATGGEPVVFDLVRHLPPPPIRVWMDVGTYEPLLPANQRMHALLRERGYDVTYREQHGGHNYTAWRDSMWRGLEALYGTR
jgi:enterochelin esterase family protein